ncbi:unnamed protein product [Brugia pahangi]|uniref:Secreted protein n=1 Tax=Brugia pahangi TaxID=6280 RepID=A0A0N4T1B6_BRUPA|nr:unnamed protein product [Brugia pahangi]
MMNKDHIFSLAIVSIFGLLGHSISTSRLSDQHQSFDCSTTRQPTNPTLDWPPELDPSIRDDHRS